MRKRKYYRNISWTKDDSELHPSKRSFWSAVPLATEQGGSTAKLFNISASQDVNVKVHLENIQSLCTKTNGEQSEISQVK